MIQFLSPDFTLDTVSTWRREREDAPHGRSRTKRESAPYPLEAVKEAPFSACAEELGGRPPPLVSTASGSLLLLVQWEGHAFLLREPG